MKLILTSSAHSVAHDIVKHVDFSKGNRLAFIDTAAEPEKDGDISWLLDDRAALVDAGFDATDYTITEKSKEDLEKFLNDFDFIYLSGGHTEHLQIQAYKSGFIDVIKDLVKNGKTYIGTSAGSIITGPIIPEYLRDEVDYPEAHGKEAFGFVNFIVVPHWGSEGFKELYLKERIETMYDDSVPPYVLLSDTQYLVVKDDSVTMHQV